MSASPTEGARTPDATARQNTVVITLFFCAGIVFLDRFGISYLFKDIGPALGLNNAQLGSLMSVTAVSWAVSGILFSAISDRLGGRSKPFLVGSLVLFSIAVGLVGFAPDYGTMLALRALVGFCEGPAMPLIQAITSRSSSAHRRGRNLGIVSAGTTFIGLGLAPTIMIGLGQLVGWRLAFPFVTLPGLVAAAVVWILVKDAPAPAPGPDKPSLAAFGRVIANRNVLLALVCSTVTIGATLGNTAFTPLFLDRAGLDAGTATFLLSASGLLSAAGNIVTPTLSDRIGRRPALAIAAICFGLVPLGTVLLVHSVGLLVLVLLLQLFAGGALTLSVAVIPAESVSRTMLTTVFALQTGVAEIVGGILGPQIGGAVADATGSLGNALLIYAAAPVLILVCVAFMRETAPRRARVPAVVTAAETTGDLVP